MAHREAAVEAFATAVAVVLRADLVAPEVFCLAGMAAVEARQAVAAAVLPVAAVAAGLGEVAAVRRVAAADQVVGPAG